MSYVNHRRHFVLVLFSLITLSLAGCTREEAADRLSKAETSAGKAAETVSDDVGAAVEKGEALASKLSEKTKAYVSQLRTDFGDLDSLKETPEKLKTAVSDLIQSIETKVEETDLSAGVSEALATVKEKLIALRDYLQGEYDQAKVDQRIQEIKDSLKSAFGM